MNILAISFSYPHISRPYSGLFVKNTLVQMVKLGHNVTVVAPQKLFAEQRMAYFTFDDGLKVFRPRFFSFGAKSFGRLNSYILTQKLFDCAVLNVIKKEMIIADVIYSHFLLPSGHSALCLSKHLKAKTFCVLGEDSLLIHEAKFSFDRLCDMYHSFDGIIFNSGHTKYFVEKRYGKLRAKNVVIPNGVDPTIFFPKDKVAARNQLGLPLDEKIVIFVGSFVERKGPKRVLEACSSLVNPPKMIFIGSGSQLPEGANVLFAGPADHSLLPDYLSAADVFVLPTFSEGMPNAIIEAMACNLPIVTSAIEPNVTLLGQGYPFFCDPHNIASIAKKIQQALLLEKIGYSNIPTTQGRAKAISKLIAEVTV